MIIDLSRKTLNAKKEITEKELQDLIVRNFEFIFPGLFLIDTEIVLKGDVRLSGMSGRIDILGLDDKKENIVVFELKKMHCSNILIQAIDYCDFIQENIESIVGSFSNVDSETKKKILKKNLPPEIILIANSFNHPALNRIEKITNKVELYTYQFYDNSLLRMELIRTNLPFRRLIEVKAEKFKSKNLENHSAFRIIMELIKLGYAREGVQYLIAKEKITINPQSFFNKYIDFVSGRGEFPFSRTEFYSDLKMDSNFIQAKSSIRLNGKVTSGFEFKTSGYEFRL